MTQQNATTVCDQPVLSMLRAGGCLPYAAELANLGATVYDAQDVVEILEGPEAVAFLNSRNLLVRELTDVFKVSPTVEMLEAIMAATAELLAMKKEA